MDVVAGGYDAGIEIGEVIDKDMIAVPVSGDLQLAIVGAPAYFARHRAPKHPRDLTEHTCINWHRSPDDPAYRWEFTEKGRDFSVAVDSRVLSNDSDFNLRLAAAGVGLAITFVDMAREWVERGELVRVLAAYCPPFPGCSLYYPHGGRPRRRCARWSSICCALGVSGSRSRRGVASSLRAWTFSLVAVVVASTTKVQYFRERAGIRFQPYADEIAPMFALLAPRYEQQLRTWIMSATGTGLVPAFRRRRA